MEYGNPGYGIVFPVKCRLCGRESRESRGVDDLREHLKRKHSSEIDYKGYMKREYGIDVAQNTYRNRGVEFPVVCVMCGKSIKNLTGLARHLKMSHGGHSYISYIKDFLGVDIGLKQEERVECLICHRSFFNLAVHLCKKHRITKEEYEKQYGRTEFQKSIVKERATRGVLLHSNSVRGLSPENRLKKTLGEEEGCKAYQRWREGMAGVFTLEWFKRKYGPEDGESKYNERKKSLIELAKRRPFALAGRNQWSLISQKLFWDIYKTLEDKSGIYFGELNHEFGCGTNRNFDFVCLPKKKIIEFNGTKFHPRPPLDENWRQVYTNKTASCVYEEDKRKNTAAESKGFSIKFVWEDEYKQNPQSTLEDCIAFLGAI